MLLLSSGRPVVFEVRAALGLISREAATRGASGRQGLGGSRHVLSDSLLTFAAEGPLSLRCPRPTGRIVRVAATRGARRLPGSGSSGFVSSLETCLSSAIRLHVLSSFLTSAAAGPDDWPLAISMARWPDALCYRHPRRPWPPGFGRFVVDVPRHAGQSSLRRPRLTGRMTRDAAPAAPFGCRGSGGSRCASCVSWCLRLFVSSFHVSDLGSRAGVLRFSLFGVRPCPWLAG